MGAERASSVIPLAEIGMADLPQVGGKNASLGEMISRLASSGVRVPGGFATTARAYRAFAAKQKPVFEGN